MELSLTLLNWPLDMFTIDLLKKREKKQGGFCFDQPVNFLPSSLAPPEESKTPTSALPFKQGVEIF